MDKGTERPLTTEPNTYRRDLGVESAFARNGVVLPNDQVDYGDVGLSKRELFAAMAMQSILTGAVTRGCPSNEWVEQEIAVRCADALLKELAK